MKKYLLLVGLLATLSGAYADTPTSCGTFGSAASGCSYCFTASGKPYENDGITSSDRWSNTSTNQWQYLWVGAGRYSVGITELNSSSWNQSDTLSNMYEIPLVSGTAGGVPYVFYYPGESSTWIRTKSGQFFRFVNHGSATSRNTPLFRIAYTMQVTPQTPNGPYGDSETHKQCTFVYGRWCGDGVIDTDKGEQCDSGANNGTGTCTSTCQNQVASCTNLSVTPTSVTNGGTVTYTCTGNNATSYSIVAKRPDGTTLTSSTSAAGSIILPATPTGTYTVSCYVNGQVTTPASCEKTVTNNTTVTPVCTGLSVSPTSLTDGGNVGYTCTGTNVSSYSVVFSKPDGTTLQSFSTATGTATIPATPTGTYTARCYVNGQTTTPAICEKTITNNGTTVTPAVLITKTDANNADLDGNIGGNDSQTVYTGNSAVFRIRVTNTGTEDLKNINLTDSIAPSCSGGVVLPGTYPSSWSSFTTGGSGNHSDTLLQPGEYFEYICDKGNTTSNYTNVARVDAQGNTSNTPVFDDDPTVVIIHTTTVTTCNNLSLSASGNTVYYSCTGSGNITGYTINQNGTFISNNSSGSLNVANGTHTFTCYINNSITSSSCQKTITINPPTQPQIQVVKDDNDNHDDSQFLQNGATAQFTIVVRNSGSEPLDTVTLSDPYAPECNRGSAETLNMIVNVGNRDARLDPGESFSYVCTRANADPSTFPNNENRVCVNGRGITSGIVVNSCDTTRIGFGTATSVCQNMQVTQNGNQTNVYCSPTGGYKLFVLRGTQVINTLQNPTGQFNLTLNDGTYKVVCLRDGEQSIQPACQKTVTINPKQDYCTLNSAVSYGGAPLRTQLNCSSPTYAQCAIKIWKDGKPWRSVAGCNADMIFTERGVYDARCVV